MNAGYLQNTTATVLWVFELEEAHLFDVHFPSRVVLYFNRLLCFFTFADPPTGIGIAVAVST